MAELSKNQSYTVIGGLVMFLLGGGGSAVVWGFDQRYQKISDAKALTDAVEQNSRAQQETASSVDKMLVHILQTRINDLQERIEILEEKEHLTTIEREALRDAKNELQDAKQERETVLGRVLRRGSE